MLFLSLNLNRLADRVQFFLRLFQPIANPKIAQAEPFASKASLIVAFYRQEIARPSFGVFTRRLAQTRMRLASDMGY